VSFHRIGYVLSAQGKLTKGLQYCQEGLAILLKLNALDLTNTLWQRDLAGVYFELHRYSEAAEILKSLVAHALKQGDVQTNKQVLANDYHILARYELLNRKPKNALTSSKNGLNLNSNESMNTLINTNLAHSYLFSGQYRKAKELYLNNKDKKVPNGCTFKQAVLVDFKEFRKRGIKHPDMEKIEKLLH
jgi:tetratricopeptide (TPR) repeat protein